LIAEAKDLLKVFKGGKAITEQRCEMIEGLIELMTRLLLLPTEEWLPTLARTMAFLELSSKGIDTTTVVGDSDSEEDCGPRP